jgi:hypothetical protein
MTIVDAEVGTLLEPPCPISPENVNEGVRILNSLDLVNQALLRDETISFEVIKDTVFREITKSHFIQYIRKVAGYERPNQRKMVAYLLVVCFERSKQDIKSQAG